MMELNQKLRQQFPQIPADELTSLVEKFNELYAPAHDWHELSILYLFIRDMDKDGRIDTTELLKLCKKSVQNPNYDEIFMACREVTAGSEGVSVPQFLSVP